MKATRARRAGPSRLLLAAPALLTVAIAEPTLAASCSELSGARIPATAIALPTSGAKIGRAHV